MKEDILIKAVNTKWIGKNLHFYKEIDSTNIAAKKCIESDEPNGTLIVADKQTKGRGRRGRDWESPPGEAVYMSLGLRLDFEPQKASMLNPVMGLSVAEAVEETTGLRTEIKWPNDLVAGGRKICGILTEMSMETKPAPCIVIGAGLNVNQESFSGELSEKATSLFLATGRKFSRTELIAGILLRFEANYECFLRTLDLSVLRGAYEERLINKDKRVRILDPQGEYEGIAKGITDTGELIVEKEDGAVENVYAGEVSVRGYYGYV